MGLWRFNGGNGNRMTADVGKGETGRDALCSVQVRGSACLSTTVRATDYLR